MLGVVAFMISILLHELAHALTARRYGVQTKSIELWALGGMARLDRESPTPRAEGMIAAAGPLASGIIAVVSLTGWWWLRGTAVDPNLISMIGWLGLVNGVVAIFNLLPGAPLDGGRIVRAVRWGRHGDRYRASREAARAGSVLGWGLAGFGLWLTVSGGPGLFLMITGVFIAMTARAEQMTSDLLQRLSSTCVGDLTWYGLAHAAPSTDAAAMLLDRQRIGNAGALVVTDELGNPMGLVLERHLWDVPEDRRSSVTLPDLMTPLADEVRAAPADTLAEVIVRLDPRRRIVTVWDDDRLVGVIPPDTLDHRLRTAQRTA
jgi:Zn-dependent protease